MLKVRPGLRLFFLFLQEQLKGIIIITAFVGRWSCALLRASGEEQGKNQEGQNQER
jgi:hypothetical protein